MKTVTCIWCYKGNGVITNEAGLVTEHTSSELMCEGGLGKKRAASQVLSTAVWRWCSRWMTVTVKYVSLLKHLCLIIKTALF